MLDEEMQNISLKDKQLETKGSLIHLKSKHSTIPDKKSNGSLSKLMNQKSDQFQLRQEEKVNDIPLPDEIDQFDLDNNEPKNNE